MINCCLSNTQGSQGFQGFPGANGEKGTRVRQIQFWIFFSFLQGLDHYRPSTGDWLLSQLQIYQTRRSRMALKYRFFPRTVSQLHSFFITTYTTHFKPPKALFITLLYLSSVSLSLFKGWAIGPACKSNGLSPQVEQGTHSFSSSQNLCEVYETKPTNRKG